MTPMYKTYASILEANRADDSTDLMQDFISTIRDLAMEVEASFPLEHRDSVMSALLNVTKELDFTLATLPEDGMTAVEEIEKVFRETQDQIDNDKDGGLVSSILIIDHDFKWARIAVPMPILLNPSEVTDDLYDEDGDPLKEVYELNIESGYPRFYNELHANNFERQEVDMLTVLKTNGYQHPVAIFVNTANQYISKFAAMYRSFMGSTISPEFTQQAKDLLTQGAKDILTSFISQEDTQAYIKSNYRSRKSTVTVDVQMNANNGQYEVVIGAPVQELAPSKEYRFNNDPAFGATNYPDAHNATAYTHFLAAAPAFVIA